MRKPSQLRSFREVLDQMLKRVRPEQPGTLGRYFVRSDDGQSEYLVDLGEFNGVGQCGCPWFQFHGEPTAGLRIHGKPNYGAACKHCVIARVYEGLLLAEAWHKNQPKEEHE